VNVKNEIPSGSTIAATGMSSPVNCRSDSRKKFAYLKYASVARFAATATVSSCFEARARPACRRRLIPLPK
jgi:hypothetical protein